MTFDSWRAARALWCAAVALVMAPGTTVAQRPDFSGLWVRADSAARPSVAATGDASFRTGDMGGVWGSPVTIVQGADSLVITWVHFATYDLQPPLRFAYAVNGAESRNAIMIGHATSVQRSRLAWRDNALVITTQHPLAGAVSPRGGSVEVRQTLSLDATGALVVETTRDGVNGGAPTTVRSTFTRR